MAHEEKATLRPIEMVVHTQTLPPKVQYIFKYPQSTLYIYGLP